VGLTAPAARDGEPTKARDEPSPVAPSASSIAPSTNNENTESPGQSAPDFGVSEIITFQLTESEAAQDATASAKSWTWDGVNWTVSHKPGSTYTAQFILRVKGTDGRWHYASATGLSLAEFNRRFTNQKFVADKLHKVTRKQSYEKFKELCFETWKAQAVRTDLAFNRFAAGDS